MNERVVVVNKHFERWALQAISEMEGHFSVHQVRTKVLEAHRDSKYLESNSVIGYLLKRHCVKVADQIWRVADDETTEDTK
jgi:hypothetical protein